MPDRIKEAFEATKDNGIFLDEEDFRNSLAKEPKAVFELFKSDKKYGDLFLDYDDFENSLGLKKKPSTSDASIFAPPISQGTGQSVKLPPTPTSSTASPSASKPQKSTTPSVSTGEGKKVSVPPITDKPIQLKQRPKTGVSDFVTPQEFEQQIKDKPTSANDKFIEDVNTNVLEIVKRDLDTFVYQKDMPTMYGTKKIPAGTPNVENIAKAVDLYAEKVKKETGQDISNTDKQYIINSTIESLKVRNQTQKAAMLTDLQFQQEKKVPLVAITGVKNEKGEILKQSMFQEGISKTLAEEQSRLNQIAKTPNKEISAEFAPELQSLNAEVKTSADILNKEMQDYFNSNFSQQQQQLYDKYNGLVQSGQMTEDMANEELKQKLQAIQEEIKLDTNDVFAPKLNQLKQEAESKVKEIQTRYNRKVEAQFELEKQKSAKRIEAQILEYENALPEGYMKEYQAAFQKNLDNEMNLEGLKKISEFSNLGNFEKMQTALMAGWGDVASTIGGALSYAGVNTGNLQNWVAQSGLYNELPVFNDDNVFDNLTNTDWWIANGVRSIPFTLATMPVGIFGGATAGVLARALGATKRAQMISSVVGGGLVGWEVERFLEQGAGFNDAINEGKSLEEAAEIAAAIGKYNYSTLPMNMLQMLPVFNKSFKFLGAAGIEAGAGAFEEINQGWAQAKAKAKSEGQDVSYLEYATSPQAIQEGAIGAAMSQGFTLLSLKNTPDIDKQINTLMTSIGMGGEAQALEVLKTMRNNGAIDDKQFQEATNLLNYTLTAISQTENINIDDSVKSALVNRFVAIEKAKELLTENENDLASQAAKELIAEKETEIKSILKGSEPVYLIRVTGNDVPVVSTKEEVESLLKSEKMLPLFEIEVYNDNKTKASVEEVYAKIAPAEEKVEEQNESRISQEDTTAGDTAVEVAEPVIEEGERQDKEETPAVKEEITPEQIEIGKEEIVSVKEGKTITKNPIRLFKGLFGKRNPDGTRKSAHPDVKGVFTAVDEKIAERYMGEDGMGIFDIPVGTTIEVIRLENKKVPISKFREQETDAVNASDAQIVKLITLDAKGAEEQYIIKDPALIEKMQNPEDVKQTKEKQEDAVQKQTAGQVPVQPEAEIGEGVEGGKPKAEPKKVAEEKQEEDLGYHGGNLKSKSDFLTVGYRGDQPFTGYYFFSDRERAEARGNRTQLDNKEVSVVDFSKYNLLKPTTNQYWVIKSGLKKFEDAFLRDGIDAAFDSLERYGGMKYGAKFLYEQILQNKELIKKVALDWYENELGNINEKKKIERLETLVLKALGYEGVDVRGLKESDGDASPDSSSEGSVIFDLKPDTILESPDMPKAVSEEEQGKVKFPENVLKIAKELNLSPQQVENTYKKYDGSKNIEDITLEDYNKARAEGNKIKVEKSKKAFEVLLKEGSVSPTAKKKAAEVKKEVGEKTIKDAEEIMNNIDSIRQQLLDAGVIKSINCKWGK